MFACKVAAEFDLSKKTVQRRIECGEIEAFKVGSTWQTKAVQVERLKKSSELQAGAGELGSMPR